MQTPSSNNLMEELFAELSGMKRQIQGMRSEGHNPLRQFNVSSTQMEILFALSHSQEPVTTTALADRLLVSSGAVTQTVDLLVKRGIIERQPSPEDRRVQHLALTAEGQDFVARIRQTHADHLRRIFAGIPEDDLRLVTAAFRRLRLHLENRKDPDHVA